MLAASLSAQTTWQIGSPNLADVTATLSADSKTLTISGTGDMAFYDYYQRPWYGVLEQITSLTVGNGVTNISSKAFDNMTNLATATIGNSVDSIGGRAFSRCGNLASVTIGSSVKSIGSDAFTDCRSLTSIVLPNSVTSVGEFAFSSCGSLASISLGNSLVSIGNTAFLGCASLQQITIPASVKSMGSLVFRNCAQLSTITFMGKKPDMGSNIFYGVGNITLRHLRGLKSWEEYSYCCGATVTIETYEDYEALNTFYQEALAAIDQLQADTLRLFNDKKALQADTARLNTELADCEASKLPITWEIGKTNPSDVIATLSGDKTTLTISGNGEMQDFSGSGTVPWPGYIGDITTVVVKEGVTNIGVSAFANSRSLTSVSIPQGVTSIGAYAFNISNLDSISLPEGVTSIGQLAFANCYSLSVVSIPSSVESIGEGAFMHCDITKIVNLSREPQPINSDDFTHYVTGNPLTNVALHVPFCFVEAYKAADVWKDLGAITGINTEECLLDSIVEQNKVIVALAEDTASLNSVIFALAEDTASLNSVIFALAEDTASLNSVIFALAEDTASLNTVIVALKTDTAELIADTVRLYELLTLCEENSDDNAALLQIIANLKIDTAVLNNNLALLRNDTALLNATIIILHNDKTALMTDTAALNAESARLQALLDNCGTGIGDCDESQQLQALRDSLVWLNQVLDECENPRIALQPMLDTEVKVHPNPVDTELRITIVSDFIGYSSIVELYDMIGRRIYLGHIPTGIKEHTIDMTNFQPGLYILRVGNRMTKIIKK
jgi:hypothetical protein